MLAVDLPGHGRSGGAALTSVEAMADWLLALLDAAGAGRPLLAGHSMGSLIALEAAARAPGARHGPGPARHDLADEGVGRACWPPRRTTKQRAIDMVNIWSHSRCSPQAVLPRRPAFPCTGVSRRLMQRMARANPDQLFHTDFSACNAYANGGAAAAGVTCPTLFVLGARDMMTPPRSAQALTSAHRAWQNRAAWMPATP